MGRLIIKGGNTLRGTVRLSGAKNLALPVLFGALLAKAEVTLENVPLGLNDIRVTLKLLQAMGARITVDEEESSVTFSPSPLLSDVPANLASKIRSSLLLLSIGLLRNGSIELPFPGGCTIGERKFDLHLMGLRELGADVEEKKETIVARAAKLAGAEIEFTLPTTSGTENIVLAATGAEGSTTIYNANTRPEVVEFCRFLCDLGADIEVRSREITINGGKPLDRTARFRIMPDRHEAMTYVIAAGITDGEVKMEGLDLSRVPSDVRVLEKAGVQIFEWGGEVFAKRGGELRAFELETGQFPGINSDMQPIFAALALYADGVSTLCDTRFTDRFQYAPEMAKLGAEISIEGNCARIEGSQRLHGGVVTAPDLRGGAALSLVALGIPEETVVENTYQIYRGYQDFAGKLASLGTDVKLVENED